MKKIFYSLLILFSFTFLFSFENTKNPFLAGTLSLTIPGGGQLYNRNYYKFSAAFALESYFIINYLYHLDKKNNYYDKARKYESNEQLYTDYVNQYNHYNNKCKNDLWWLGTTVFLSVLDAYVDAHLSNYNSEKEKVRILFRKKKLEISYSF